MTEWHPPLYKWDTGITIVTNFMACFKTQEARTFERLLVDDTNLMSGIETLNNAKRSLNYLSCIGTP